MRLLPRLALLLALLPGPSGAAETWIEATGQAIAATGADRDAARRRAIADALLEAALAGGAEVTGHSVTQEGRTTSDLLIVRPVGRVLEHHLISASLTGDLWQVRLRARIGPAAQGACQHPRRLLLTAHAPRIEVANAAPAWALAVADDIAARLADGLGRTAGIGIRRLSAQPMADQPAPLTAGEHAFGSRIRLDTATQGNRRLLRLDLDMVLHTADEAPRSERLRAQVRLPGVSPFGRLDAALQPDRHALAGALTRDVEAALHRLLETALCAPVAARLSVAGGRITAPVGRDQGLSRGAIAFTADRDASVTMLEIVELGAARVRLRPLDPDLPAASFAGRPVRFLETGE